MGWFGVVSSHPRLSVMSPFDGADTSSYSSLIETRPGCVHHSGDVRQKHANAL